METIEIIPDTELTPFAAWQEGLLSPRRRRPPSPTS